MKTNRDSLGAQIGHRGGSVKKEREYGNEDVGGE